ncbi:hypothetical protein GCM10027610_082800 [Dactylosporangium cerinum]
MAVAVHRIRPALRSSLPAGDWLIIERELDSAAATLSDERRTAEHPAAALTVVRLMSTAETGRKLLAGRLAAQDAIVARVPGADRAALLGALAVVDLDASPATAADRGSPWHPAVSAAARASNCATSGWTSRPCSSWVPPPSPHSRRFWQALTRW